MINKLKTKNSFRSLKSTIGKSLSILAVKLLCPVDVLTATIIVIIYSWLHHLWCERMQILFDETVVRNPNIVVRSPFNSINLECQHHVHLQPKPESRSAEEAHFVRVVEYRICNLKQVVKRRLI